MVATKVMKLVKAKKVQKAKTVLKAPVSVGKFGKGVAASKRSLEEVAAKPSESENPMKKNKVKPQDEKSLVAARKVELAAMKFTDLVELHKGVVAGNESVKDMLARTKEDLSSKGQAELKTLCAKKELKVGGAKGDLVQRLLEQAKDAFKSDLVQSLLAQEAKVREVVLTLKKEVASKTGDELKQLLTEYGLKTGGSKDEKIDRIVTRQKENGAVEKCLAAMARDTRKNELLSMDAQALMDMCSKTKELLDDRLMKEVMVDRLLLVQAQ